MKLTKKELKDLKKYGCDITILEKANGVIINSLIVLSNGLRNLHDSGFPLIKIIGVTKGKHYVDLGYHDHFLCYVPVNVDSFGKNIFHLMPWVNNKKEWKVCDTFISCSTFSIGDIYYDDNGKYVVLR